MTGNCNRFRFRLLWILGPDLRVHGDEVCLRMQEKWTSSKQKKHEALDHVSSDQTTKIVCRESSGLERDRRRNSNNSIDDCGEEARDA
jgi:hypothetical protein